MGRRKRQWASSAAIMALGYEMDVSRGAASAMLAQASNSPSPRAGLLTSFHERAPAVFRHLGRWQASGYADAGRGTTAAWPRGSFAQRVTSFYALILFTFLALIVLFKKTSSAISRFSSEKGKPPVSNVMDGSVAPRLVSSTNQDPGMGAAIVQAQRQRDIHCTSFGVDKA